MKKEMLINVLQPEECRIAILEDGVLEELYVERTSHESYVGNIYKGRIVNIEPSIQAAFVDFGVGRNGFLHVSDVEPAYYRHLEGRHGERQNGRRDRGRDRDRDRDRGRDRGRDRDRGGRPVRFEEEPEYPAREAPPEVLPPADDREAAAFVELVESQAEAPPLPEESTFGEGLDIPESPAGPESAGPSVEEEVQPTSTEEPAAPLQASPETRIEEEPAKGRRRGRAGSRRRRGGAAEAGAEAEAGREEGAEAAGAEPAEEPAPDRPEKPPLMESAERRTTEKDSGPDSAPEISPPSAGGGGAGFEDPDIFFSAPAERPEPPRRAEAPEPAGPSRPAEPEYRTEERRPARRESAQRRGGGASRGRPSGGGRRGSIEDDLEADLAAADIGAAPGEAPDTDFSGAGADFEPEPGSEPAPVEQAPPEFDEGFDEGFGEGFEEDRLPPPRERREEGRGRREEGRGRREEGGRRGRRGDRRGDRRGGRPGMGRPKPLIQDIFKRGQEVLVQVIKEGIGTKGPTLSTYISIAGRYLVLMPGLNRVGVSRKIADDEQRRRLREIFNELKPPRGLGFIIRTAGIDKNKKELQNDLAYLSRLWEVVVRRVRKMKAPAEIYQESDMITRTIRDTFTADIDTIWVDEAAAFEHAQEFLKIVMPRYANRIKLYEGTEPLFHKYRIEDEIARIQQRKVPLPYGGSIVIEQTEALVAIDVNSGNFRADRQDAEETAYQMNLQAAKEIARQLRLRDLGGVIVNDFIDMRDEKHRRAVEKAMRDAVKRDRARTKVLKISAFGIIEMTRQRIRPSLKRSVYQDCPYCHGMAQVKTVESMSIDVMRMLQLAAHREHVHHVEVRVAAEVADYLLNKKRQEIARLEESGNIQVRVQGTQGAPPEALDFVCYDNNNNEVKLLPGAPEPVGRPRR